MKKLLIALTAAAGLAGFAKADTTSLLEQGFEGTAGTKVTAEMLNVSATKWVVPSGDCSELGSWANEAQFTPSGYPGGFQTFGDTFLGVSNADPLLAAFGIISDETLPEVAIGEGLYVDTYVKFTATETAPTPGADDKLIVWMYGSDAEENPQTNLIVTAGNYLGGTPSACNYVVNANVEPDTWHRLTIRTKSASTNVTAFVTAFRVYIDGTEVTITGKLVDGEISTEDLTVGDSAYASTVTDPTAHQKLTDNQLFPSLKANTTALSCVGLEGWGAVDDFVLTTQDPFPDTASSATLELDWNTAAFKSLKYQIGDEDAEDLTTSPAEISGLAPGATVKITYELNPGYMIGAFEAGGQCDVSGNTFTIKSPLETSSASGKLTTSLIAATVDGTSYATLAEAIAAAKTSEDHKLILGNDLELTGDDCGDAYIGGDSTVIFDLAGKKITATQSTAGVEVGVIDNSGTLTIIDSVGGGEIATDGSCPAVSNSGSLEIQAGKFTGDILIAEDATATSLTGGTFLDNDGTEGFYLQTWVATDYAATSGEDNYWTVAEVEKPTTFTVTVAAADANSTVTVVSNGVTVAYAESYTLNEGDAITVTYTPNTGYQFALGATTEFTLDADGEASEAPTATAISYTITYEFNEGDDTVKAAWAQDYTAPASYTIESEDITLPITENVTREGYTFEGWFDSAEPGKGAEAITTIAKGSTGDKTFYAKWTPVSPVGPAYPTVNEGETTTAEEFLAAAKAGTTIELPTDWTREGNVIKDAKGATWATLPSYYNISDGGAVSLNEAAVKPVVNNGTSNPGIVVGAKAAINVTNPQAGLFYILKRAATVTGSYEPVVAVQATGDDKELQLTDPTDVGTAAFYKVEVTDKAPVVE